MGVGRVHGGLFAFIEGMCVFVHGCVCVSLCVCVCVCVCVPGGGGQVQGNVCGCGDFVIAYVVLVWLFCQCPAKMVRNSHEFRTKFVRNWYECRTNLARNLSPKCTVNVVVTNFVRNSHEFRTTFDQFA